MSLVIFAVTVAEISALNSVAHPTTDLNLDSDLLFGKVQGEATPASNAFHGFRKPKEGKDVKKVNGKGRSNDAREAFVDDAENERSGQVQLARDLAFMSADVSKDPEDMSKYIQDTLGWIPKLSISVKPEAGGEDKARVYAHSCDKDDYCLYCALLFAATDDSTDTEEDVDMEPVEFCGFEDVHRGFAFNVEGYVNNSQFSEALTLTSAKHCKHSIVAGHSLGGAVASLMAYCNNLGGHRPLKYNVFDSGPQEFMLVTFGGPASSKKPLFNYEHGNPFRGQRFTVWQKELPPITPEFAIDVTKLCADILDRMGHDNLYDAVMEEYVMLKRLYEKKAYRQFRDQMHDSQIRLGKVLYMVSLTKFTDEFMNRQVIMEYLELARKHNDVIRFEYDTVPVLYLLFQYVHPHITWQPLTHPYGQYENLGAERNLEWDPWQAIEPVASPLRSLIGTISNTLNGQWLPNHMICCYIEGIDPSTPNCPDNVGKVGECPAAKYR